MSKPVPKPRVRTRLADRAGDTTRRPGQIGRRGWRSRRWLVLIVSLVLGVLCLSAPTFAAASGTPDADGADSACALPQPVEDEVISILGRICDRRERPPAPVVGVTITVNDDAGEAVGQATTGPDGTFAVDLPGSAIDNLGETFTVNLDEETLPADTKPEVLQRAVAINLDNDQSVTFPVGADDDLGSSAVVRGLQLLVGGIVFSVLLAMAALGLSMVFGTTGLTNFAHGELITFGALVAFAVDAVPGQVRLGGINITVAVAVISAFAVSGIAGWLSDAGLWAPLRRRGTGVIAMMIVSIGLSIFLRNLYQYVTGAKTRNYSQFSAVEPWEVGPILITPKEVAVTLVGVAVLGVVTSLLQFTRVGKAARAVADNPALSAATGVNVSRVIRVVWVAGTALAGLSGALLGLTQGFDYQLGFKLLLLVFAAVVLGGLGTIWGAIFGALIIGLFTELSTLLVPAEFKFVGALLVLIIVLLFRPQGLLGRAQRIG